MATTTNYNWATPDDSDLLKDGASAIRTLGSSADTTVKNLNPGTTAGDIDYYTSATAKARIAIGTANQVLQVNSGATAPEWGVDPVADVITTAGDLIYGTTADTVTRLGIGTAGQVLQVNSGATAPEWAAPAGGGKVLQVVQATYTTSTQSTSATYADTGLSLAITPSSATSKVLVLVNQSTYSLNSSDPTYMGLRIVRTSTAILTSAGAWALNFGVTGAIVGYTALTYLDSPNTTSATTYKTQFNRSTGAGSVTVQESSYPSIITLMEIGA